MTNDHHSQRGAVFFYILLAIALLAALSYAVSRGNRGGTSTMTDQQSKLAAQEIIDYSNNITATVQKLRLRGCSDTEISFENSVGSQNYTNPNAPTDKSCHIYDINGGNLIYSELSTNLFIKTSNPSFFTGPRFNSGFQHEGIGSIENDLVLKITWITKDTCLKINDLLNVENPSNAPPTENNDSATLHFIGAYGSTATDTIGDDGTGLEGKNAFCRHRTSSDIYQFNQILIAR
jgi:hypothetical protein